MRRYQFLLLVSLLALAAPALSKDEVFVKEASNSVFAIVNGEEISIATFKAVLHASARRKFFHGNIEPQQWADFTKKTGLELVDRFLLLQEATRRKILVDQNFVQKELQKFSQKDYNEVASSLEDESRIVQLQAIIQYAVAISSEDVINYYKIHPEKFTVPEQFKVRLILLKVPPYAPLSQWDAAMQQGQAIYKQVQDGANFGDLAQQHSNHESAAQRGSLGVVHQGMFANEVQEAIDQMKPGDISKPLRLLQGIALLQLEEKIAPSLLPFETVKLRAKTILTEERKQEVWNGFVERLRQKTPITINWAAL